MAGFYAARSRTIPPLPWTNFAPPFSADPYLKKYYDEGVICWRPGTRTRPAGLIVTEPITFRNKLAAAEFLAAGKPFQEQWVPI